MQQLVQLQENISSFEQAGIAVVAMTYDAPELQQAFVEQHGISYPLLSDVNAISVIALDILNTQYQPGDGNYGIPYPGIYVLDRNLDIAGKIFVEGYSTRVDASGVLGYARQVLE